MSRVGSQRDSKKMFQYKFYVFLNRIVSCAFIFHMLPPAPLFVYKLILAPKIWLKSFKGLLIFIARNIWWRQEFYWFYVIK
jgi:hypothetical protein